jgi:riboflavin synthase
VFTGLVEDLGTVVAVERSGDGARLTIETRLAAELGEGDSISVCGVCLTARDIEAGSFHADVVNETLRRSSLGALEVGRPVNLELAMKADGRFGGHIVQGHVDGVGVIESVTEDGMSQVMRVRAEESLLRYVVEKGSITIDGVSLTVSAVDDSALEVALIPKTMQETTLGRLVVDAAVNLETDLFAKYAEKLAGSQR